MKPSISPALAEYIDCWQHGVRPPERSDEEKAQWLARHDEAVAYLQSLVLEEIFFYDQVHAEAVYLQYLVNGAVVSHRMACETWEVFYSAYNDNERVAQAACLEKLRLLEQYVIRQKRYEGKPCY